MKLDAFLAKLKNAPETLMLDDTLNTIDALYEFTQVAFSNGSMHNQAGEAVRSCKLYTFASLHQLTEQHTLTCFGEHYREVLAEPQGTNHMTIRIFMRQGWSGLSFDGMPLKERAKLAGPEVAKT